MVFGHWGWFGDGDIRGIESRYNTLISDPVLSAPFGLLLGYLIVRPLKLPSMYECTRHWWHVLVLVVEYFLLGFAWKLYTPPVRVWQLDNWSMLVLAFVYPLLIGLVYLVNQYALAIYSDSARWLQAHARWAAVSFFLLFMTYLNCIVSAQITCAITATVLAALLSILNTYVQEAVVDEDDQNTQLILNVKIPQDALLSRVY